MELYATFGGVYSAWSRSRLSFSRAGVAGLQQAIADYIQPGNRTALPFFLGLLAERQAEAQDIGSAIATIDEALARASETGERLADSFLHRLCGDILLKRDPSNPVPGENAYRTAIAAANQQGARSYELLASLALARLCQSTRRPADAHAALAPALEGFLPTPEMPEIAEAQALLEALAESHEVKAAVTSRSRMLQLQTRYGFALTWSRGIADEETQAAAARTKQLAAEVTDPTARFAAYRGQFVTSLVGGHVGAAHSTAETYLGEAKKAGSLPDIASASMALGHILMLQGALDGARDNLKQGREIHHSGPKFEVPSGHSLDSWTYGTSILALVCWQLGEVERAQQLIDEAKARSAESQHGMTLATAYSSAVVLEAFRGDAEACIRDAETLAEIAAKVMLPGHSDLARIYRGWARARRGDRGSGLEELRQGLVKHAEQTPLSAPLHQGLLAELEAEEQDIATALARIDEALALAEQTDQRWTDAFLHRIRGDVLLKADPPNFAGAEDAYLAAIAIGRQQGARSFELQAALNLARHYHSTGRAADAHAALAPALEGFLSAVEMREIGEARALLAVLEETDEVKADAAQRRRTTQLRVAYGGALWATRQSSSPEAAQAFARAREEARGEGGAPELLAADYGLWVGNYQRGNLPAMRTHAATFLGDVESRPDSPEASVAHRAAGLTHWFAGEYREAREHLELALSLFQAARDDDLALRFGFLDSGVGAMALLAMALWPLGDIEHAVSLVRDAEERNAALAHAGTRAYGKGVVAMFELMRGDLSRAAANRVELVRLAREHDLSLVLKLGVFLEGVATIESGAAADGLEQMRRSEMLREPNVVSYDGIIKIVLAQAEARRGDVDHAIAIVDEALATVQHTRCHAFAAELNRVRGELLLQRDTADSASAERALEAAIAIAREQGTRSFELRAALSLAKLYQSAGRPADAHALLARALEGFAPTLEMSEIAEAQALMESLA
jgi:predicted ATPase